MKRIENENRSQKTPIFIRNENLFFFRLFDRKMIKKPLKPCPLKQLELSLSDFYQLFLQFLQLVSMTSACKNPLNMAKTMVRKEGEVFFYYYTGDNLTNGFKTFDCKKWEEEILIFWNVLSEVKIYDLSLPGYQQKLEEWKQWIQNKGTQEQLSWCAKNYYINQGILQFTSALERLKISQYFNLKIRIKNFLFGSRIAKIQDMAFRFHQIQSKDEWFSTILSSNHPLRLLFESINHKMSSLFEILNQEQIIFNLENIKKGILSDSDQENENNLYLKSEVNRTLQNFKFFMKIQLESSPSQDLPLNAAQEKGEKMINLARKWMKICVSVRRTQQITVQISTTPFWSLFPSEFEEIREIFDWIKVQMTQQLQYCKNDIRIFDFLRLNLVLTKQTPKNASLVEQLSIFSRSQLTQDSLLRLYEDMNTIVIGCIDKQLLIWAVFEAMIEKICWNRLGFDLLDENYLIKKDYLKENIKKGLQIINQSLQKVTIMMKTKF